MSSIAISICVVFAAIGVAITVTAFVSRGRNQNNVPPPQLPRVNQDIDDPIIAQNRIDGAMNPEALALARAPDVMAHFVDNRQQQQRQQPRINQDNNETVSKVPSLSLAEIDLMFPAKPLYIVAQELAELKVKHQCQSIEPTEIVKYKQWVSISPPPKVFKYRTLRNKATDMRQEKPNISLNSYKTQSTVETTEIPKASYHTSSTRDIAEEVYNRQVAREIEINLFQKDCVICQASLSDSEEVNESRTENVNVRMLYCGHTFHDKCICLWLVKRAICPMCNKEVGQESQELLPPERMV